MTLAYVSTTFEQDADAVWAVLGDFHGLPAWVSRIRSGEAEGGSGRGPVGGIRRLSLEPDGRTARERLVRYDDLDRSYSYEFADEIPFAASTYRGTVRVRPITDTGGSFVEWYGEFDADPAAADQLTRTFRGIYLAFLEELRAHLRG